MPEQHTVWFEADEPIPFEDIHPTYDPLYDWSRVMALRARAVERWDDKVTIAHRGPHVGASRPFRPSGRRSSYSMTCTRPRMRLSACRKN